jgi:hypothetical protein
MGSKSPFRIVDSPLVAPITCVECGNNMYCVRREPVADGEKQLFLCAACGRDFERIEGPQPSDAEIQRAAEDLSRIKDKPE